MKIRFHTVAEELVSSESQNITIPVLIRLI